MSEGPIAVNLRFLYRRNADLCSEMAAQTKSVEVREQGFELARGWVKKAEAEERVVALAPDRRPARLALPAKAALPEIPRLQETIGVVPEPPPSEPALEDQPRAETSVQPQAEDVAPFDDFWAAIAEIRGR
jgi:hypothetical protein